MTALNLPEPYRPDPTPEFQARVNQHVMVGWRVESMTTVAAVLVSGHRCNHTLHGLLSLFTCGFWLPVWALFALSQAERRISIGILGDGSVYVCPSAKSS